MRRRRNSGPAEVLARWRAGIATLELEPAIRNIFLIGFYTGMRRGEIVSLRWECIDVVRCILRVEETKTGEPLELPISRQLATTLERHLADTEDLATQPEGWVLLAATERCGEMVQIRS